MFRHKPAPCCGRRYALWSLCAAVLIAGAALRVDARADAVMVGCSGFVKPSAHLTSLLEQGSNSEPIDYTRVMVELQSHDGFVHERTKCDEDGYYYLMAPSLQDSFLITLRGPPGWSFDATKMVVVDAATCNAGNDVDFHIYGFGLSGHILSQSPSATESGSGSAQGAVKSPEAPLIGPAGILVTIRSVSNNIESSRSGSGSAEEEGVSQQQQQQQEQQLSATAVTDASGAFTFTGLPVGAYELSATHPLWSIRPVTSTLDTSTSIPVEAGWDSTDLGAAFYVGSYDASDAQNQPGVAVVAGRGRVEDGAGRGVEGATVMVDGLSVAVTDAKGAYSFTLPTALLSSPPLQHPSSTPAPPPPPPPPNHHTLSAVRPLYSFSSLPNIALPPATTTTAAAAAAAAANAPAAAGGASATTAVDLPPIRAARYALCGRVEMGGDSSFVPWRRMELSRASEAGGSQEWSAETEDAGTEDAGTKDGTLLSRTKATGGAKRSNTGKSSSSSEFQKARKRAPPVIAEADQDGRFCFMVPRGSYQLVPEISPDEVAAGLVFSPSIMESVTVTSSPVTDIVFKQSHLFISGKVRCLQQCDSAVTVTLLAVTDTMTDGEMEGGTEQQQQQQGQHRGTFLQRVVLRVGGEGGAEGEAGGVGGKGKGRKGEVMTRGTSGSFFFDQLLPGSYRLEARKTPVDASDLQQDEWCWEEGSADVAVYDSPVTNVQLVQRGWRMVVRASMEDRFTLIHSSYDPTDFSVSPGVQEFCVESPGEYTLVMSHACAYYGALSLAFHTNQPKPILLTPTAYRVSGLVFLNTSLLSPSLSLLSLEATTSARSYPDSSSSSSSSVTSSSIESQSMADGSLGSVGSEGGGSLVLRRPPSKEDPVAVYEQSFWLEPNTDLLLSLHHSGFPATCPLPAGAAAGGVKNAGDEGMAGSGEVDLGEVDPGEINLGEGWEQQEQGKQEERNMKLEARDSSIDYPLGESEIPQEQPTPDGTFPFPPLPRLLFYPRAIPVRIDPFKCPMPLPSVWARPGIFLTARITPALPAVNVSVVADSASDARGWEAGEVVGWRLTVGGRGGGEERRGAEGKEGEEERVEEEGLDKESNGEGVVLGPLYDDARYHLELHKEGYIFLSTGANSFTAERVEATQKTCQPGSSSSSSSRTGEQHACKWES
ncbi:hypothetical protein CLOM_g13356 [Closterium sp. NIES-68]|nr:hypothetical protein CLOM_g13356 [Closterium sp. NIES-68]